MMFGSKNKIGAQVDGIGARTDGLGPHVEGAAPYLDGVGASSASDHWSSAIPRIDLSEIKSLKPEERENLTKQMDRQTEIICKAIKDQTDAVLRAKRFSKACGVLSFLAATLISIFGADIRGWLVMLLSLFAG